MKFISLLLLACVSFPAMSQDFIRQNRDQIVKENSRKNTKVVTLPDGSIQVISSSKKGSSLLKFDSSGKCVMEIWKTDCAECYSSDLKKILQLKKYGWVKVNENQYVSNFASNQLLELPVQTGEYSVTFLYTEWTKEMYDLLLKN